MKLGGIVLCGGQSRRMGRSKATLPFGGEAMLVRVVRRLGHAAHPLVVVAAPGQQLPALPPGVRVVRDRAPGCGPLEGLFCGLAALQSDAEAAYVAGCDVPLLESAFVSRMAEYLQEHDVAVPVEGTFHHPLAAIYRTRVAPIVEQLLARHERRLVSLFDHVATCRVPVDRLRDVDPDLHSLRNINQPADYTSALREAGLRPEEEHD